MEEAQRNIRVSIVEDNHFIRMALEQILINAVGYDVVALYGSGEEAVDKMPDEIPDIVLMDINMGKMSGIEAVRIIKEKCPSIQFMMCTVNEDDEKIFDALAAGASGYILKKTKSAELVAAIRDLYEGGAPMSGQIASRVVASFRKREESRDIVLLESLSAREHEILELLVKGRLYKEIASTLVISQETVRKHVYNIYKKLHVNNRVEAYNKFYGNGGSNH
jgi:DNA-binding NarL/FixJ family response regulator